MQQCIQSQIVVLAKAQSPIRLSKRQASSLLLTSPSAQPLNRSHFVKMQSALEKVKERMGAKQTPEAGLSVSVFSMAPCHWQNGACHLTMVRVASHYDRMPSWMRVVSTDDASLGRAPCPFLIQSWSSNSN
jgi:hypothetical protein